MYVKEVGILGIVILESIALIQGINGILLTMVIALIAGIAGHEFKIYRNGGRYVMEPPLSEVLME